MTHGKSDLVKGTERRVKAQVRTADKNSEPLVGSLRGEVRLEVQVRARAGTTNKALVLKDVLYCEGLSLRLLENRLDEAGMSVLKSAGKVLIFMTNKQAS